MTYIPVTMNWDWDKLQEKRQRQGRGPVNNPRGRNEEPTPPGEGRPDFGNVSGMFKRMSGMKGSGWLLLVAVGVWLLSGIYIVNPDEQGVILRFGKYNRTVEPGPHYALPYPIESRFTPKVTQVQRVEVGFRSMMQGSTFQQGANRAVPEEASMLTGDENIVNVQFSVQYRIKDPVEYLFNVSNPGAVVKSAAEAAMREVIGNSLIDSALTDGKLQIQTEATQLLQEILDRYKIGVQVLAVQLQNVHPPAGSERRLQGCGQRSGRQEPDHQRGGSLQKRTAPQGERGGRGRGKRGGGLQGNAHSRRGGRVRPFSRPACGIRAGAGHHQKTYVS